DVPVAGDPGPAAVPRPRAGEPDVARRRPELDADRLAHRTRRRRRALELARALLGHGGLGLPLARDPLDARARDAPVAVGPDEAGAPARPVTVAPGPAVLPRPVARDPGEVGRGARLDEDL